MTVSPAVVKVGGSLFDLPDLGPRLRSFLAQLGDQPALVVPGGGASADVVRALDRCHGLGDEKAHWLALRAMTLNAHFLAALLPGTRVISHPQSWRGRAEPGSRAVLDGHAFACRDEELHPDHALPHGWDTTSDTLAARAAQAASATRLILLKSVSIRPGTDWKTAAEKGWVDKSFAAMVQHAATGLSVEVVNLRTALV